MSWVSKCSKLLATAIQLSSRYKNEINNSFIDAIELAAPLHDIGKIMVSDSVLQNKKRLTQEERDIFNSHTVFGADLLKDIYNSTEENYFLRIAMYIARHHHENWDGSGYPDGLSGLDIPICARIVSIVNEYDFLRSKKSYKNVLSQEECMEIINNESGKKFDPDIVDIFNRIQYTL
jgi:putative two-component system response regulator